MVFKCHLVSSEHSQRHEDIVTWIFKIVSNENNLNARKSVAQLVGQARGKGYRGFRIKRRSRAESLLWDAAEGAVRWGSRAVQTAPALEQSGAKTDRKARRGTEVSKRLRCAFLVRGWSGSRLAWKVSSLGCKDESLDESLARCFQMNRHISSQGFCAPVQVSRRDGRPAQCNSTADTVWGPPVPGSRRRWFGPEVFNLAPVSRGIIIIIIIIAYIKKPKDRGLPPLGSGLPRGARWELEPLEETAVPEKTACGAVSEFAACVFFQGFGLGFAAVQLQQDPGGPEGGRRSPAPMACLWTQPVRVLTCQIRRLPALPVCLAVVQLLSPCSAEFAVVGPPEPVLAMVGEDAELPCQLSTKMSAETLQLMWERPSRRQVVHTYAHGQEDTPSEEYRGRTSILREDVTSGKAALQIRDIRTSDSGTYLCYFQDGDFYAKAQVQLQVAALGSDPHIEMKGYDEAGGIRLDCTSAGWYPQPQIEWRDTGGQRLSSEVATEAADPQGLYAASASVILEGGSGEVSCVIRNPLLGQERSAGLSVAGVFFRDTLPWLLSVALTVLVLEGLLLGAVYYVFRRWKSLAVYQIKGGTRAKKQAAETELQPEGRAQEMLQDGRAQTDRDLVAATQDALDLPRSLCLASSAPLLSPNRSGEGMGTLVAPDSGLSQWEGAAVSLHKWAIASGHPRNPGNPINKPWPATNRIYFEFGQEVPKRSWRMFMRLAGLEENDIVICEHENPGNLAEQQHRMLLRWQSRLGRAASPFRLLAALRRMGLRECLENITNTLVAEDILGSKDAEPPN
ncbi:uncharacterized protein AAES06_017573 [Glossophaga mutica]